MTETEYRMLLKKHHFCRDCRKQDAYTLAGRTFCAECAERQRLAKADARQDEEKRLKILEQHRQMQARYVAEHRCKTCGKKLEDGYGYKQCELCRKRQSRASQKYKHKKYGVPNLRGQNGICWQCNKNPVIDGKKLCQECYDVKLKTLANIPRNNQNHIWRRL